MKNSILLLIVLILTSCNNDSEIGKSNSLVGKWKWIESSGGIDGRIENPTTTGKSILIEFSDSTIKTYVQIPVILTTQFQFKVTT